MSDAIKRFRQINEDRAREELANFKIWCVREAAADVVFEFSSNQIALRIIHHLFQDILKRG
jgi:phosphopantetheine adenylyltransferase